MNHLNNISPLVTCPEVVRRSLDIIYLSRFRINNYHHNWYDVLAGVVLGTAVAVWAYISKENHVSFIIPSYYSTILMGLKDLGRSRTSRPFTVIVEGFRT